MGTPSPNGSQFDEGEEVLNELVVAGGDPTALLDPVEESSDLIACVDEEPADSDRGLSRSSQGDVRPAAFRSGKRAGASASQASFARSIPSVRRPPGRSSALGLSCSWPSLSVRRSGRPCLSTAAWMLVVSPPRERRMQGQASLRTLAPRYVLRRYGRSSSDLIVRDRQWPRRGDPHRWRCANGRSGSGKF